MLQQSLVKLIAVLAFGLISSNSNAWFVNINCNEGKNGERVTESSALNNFADAAGGTRYTTEKSVEGGMACKFHIKGDSTGWGTWGGRKAFPSKLGKGSEVWVRVHTFFPEDFDYNSYTFGNKLKFLRIHTQSADKGPGGSCVANNEGYNDWYIYPDTKLFGDNAFGFIKECHDRWRQFGSFKEGISIKKGVWETYEMYLKLDNIPASKGGGGLVRVWKNKELLGEFSDVPTLMTAESYAESFLIFTYWNGSAPKTQSMYIDDLVVTNERPKSHDSHGNPRIGVGQVNAVSSVSSPPQSPAASLRLK